MTKRAAPLAGLGVTRPALMSDAELQRSSPDDRSARDELVHRHRDLARRLALRYRASGENLDDLVQVANLGLVNAVARFNPDRGVSFASFAVPTILGELRRHFRDHGWAVHLPRRLRDRIVEVNGAIDRLRQGMDHPPHPEDVAAELGCSVEDVVDALEARHDVAALSLDGEGASVEGEGVPLIEQRGAVDPRFESVDDHEAAREVISRLSDADRRILGMRFGQEMTQREIAEVLGTSQMQVSRVLRRITERMQAMAAT